MIRSIAIVLLATFVSGAAQGGIISVPEDYETIWQATDAAVAGDTVSVGPGTWTETDLRGINGPLEAVAFLKPGVTLLGREGAQATTLSPDPQFTRALAVILSESGTELAVIEGFTIESQFECVGNLNGPGLAVRNCRFVGCGENAILSDGADLSLTDSYFKNNDFAEGQLQTGAVVASGPVEIEVLTCTFEHNADTAVSVFNDAGAPSVLIDSCLFDGNGDVAVRVSRASWAEIHRCTFRNHSAPGIVVGGTDGVVAECVFANQTAGAAAGLAIQGTLGVAVEVRNNTFYRCISSENAAAIFVSSERPIDLHNNVFVECEAGFPWGGVVYGNGTPSADFGCNLFFGNGSPPYEEDLSLAPTDIVGLDPQFCDPVGGDFTLRASSPAAPENAGDCGLIGAFGVGCEPISIEPQTWSRTKALYR